MLNRKKFGLNINRLFYFDINKFASFYNYVGNIVLRYFSPLVDFVVNICVTPSLYVHVHKLTARTTLYCANTQRTTTNLWAPYYCHRHHHHHHHHSFYRQFCVDKSVEPVANSRLCENTFKCLK